MTVEYTDLLEMDLELLEQQQMDRDLIELQESDLWWEMQDQDTNWNLTWSSYYEQKAN